MSRSHFILNSRHLNRKGSKCYEPGKWDDDSGDEDEDDEDEDDDDEDEDATARAPTLTASLEAFLVPSAPPPARLSAKAKAPLPQALPSSLSPAIVPSPHNFSSSSPAGALSAAAALAASRSVHRSARTRMLLAKLMAPTRPALMIRQTSHALPTPAACWPPPPSQPHLPPRSFSAPATYADFSAETREPLAAAPVAAAALSAAALLLSGVVVRATSLCPSLCLSATVVGGESAVEVAWQPYPRGLGGPPNGGLRVLPIVNADADVMAAVEGVLADSLRGCGVGVGPMQIQDVAAVLPKLESALKARRRPSGAEAGSSGLLERVLRRATGTVTSALSDFDRWLKAEADASEDAQKKPPPAAADAPVIFGKQSCVVCEESYPTPWLSSSGDGGGGGAAMSCGHWVCLPCWHGYLSNRASVGVSVVRCPAYRCVSLVDRSCQAHLMPQGPEGVKLFAKLQRFQYEKAHHSGGGGGAARVCPSPACGRLLQGVRAPEGKGGSSAFRSLPAVLMCACGAAMCEACGGEGHIGFSCQEMNMFSEKAAELEAEGQSILWLRNRTKPCPKCSYPIEKDGGCLHMRCQQCNNYFCWQCGGPGANCRSFSCSREGGGGEWHTERQNEGLKSARAPASSFSYCMSAAASARSRRARFLRQAAEEEEADEEEAGGVDAAAAADITFVVRLILLRLALGWTGVRQGGEKVWKASASALKDSLQRLEMILHARTERRPASKKQNTPKAAKTQTPRAIQAQKQRIAKQVARSQEWSLGPSSEEEGNHQISALAAILTDRELADLLELPPAAFRAAAFRAVTEAVLLLAGVVPRK